MPLVKFSYLRLYGSVGQGSFLYYRTKVKYFNTMGKDHIGTPSVYT